MAVESGKELIQVVALLGAGVVAVPLFRRLGLGSVLGYLAAGLVLGRPELGLFRDSHTILQIAELGVVMLMFVIGLAMQPSRLWALRRQIFGLGAVQVAACGALLTAVGIAAGFRPLVVGGEMAGVDLLRGNMPRKMQTPLTPPRRPARLLSDETAVVAAQPEPPQVQEPAAAPREPQR